MSILNRQAAVATAYGLLGGFAAVLIGNPLKAACENTTGVERVKELRVVGPTGKDQIILAVNERGPCIKIDNLDESSRICMEIQQSKTNNESVSRLTFTDVSENNPPVCLYAQGKDNAALILGNSEEPQIHLSTDKNSGPQSHAMFLLGRLHHGNIVAETSGDNSSSEIGNVGNRLVVKVDGDMETVYSQNNLTKQKDKLFRKDRAIENSIESRR